MAKLGISNPEELPPQLKLKPHVAKRKASEANFQNQPPLQPSGGESSSPPGSLPPSAAPKPSAGPDGKGGKFYTALALHVLEGLASAPVVSEMLRAEPHMNRDKLTKMKLILQTDQSVWDDLPAFQQKMKEVQTPAPFTPNFTFDTTPGTVSTAFGNGGMFQTSNDPQSATESQPPRLASPAQFNSPNPYPVTTQSPPPFDSNMFDGGHGSMFDSPSNEMKTSGAYGSTSQNMFESPKVGMQSPGFEGTPQYPSNIDNVFADLVHDHDTIGGFDGTAEAREKDAGVDGGSATAVTSIESVPAAEQRDLQDVEMPDATAGESRHQYPPSAPEPAEVAGEDDDDDEVVVFKG
jgi:histone demethylase JARID1